MSMQQSQPVQQPTYQSQSIQQPPYQTGQSFGQQVGQRMSQRFGETLPPEAVRAVENLERVETLSEFAKTQAIQKGLPRVALACDDIHDLAHMEKKLIVRQSPAAETMGQCIQQSVQERLQNLQQWASEPEVQEALAEAQQSLTTVSNAVSRLQAFGQQGIQSQPQQY